MIEITPRPSVTDDADTSPAADTPRDEGLIAGRPVEDRSFEAVEAGAGMLAGLAIGTVMAGPVGAAAGGILGAMAGIAAGEALERAEGRAATTTDASEALEG